MGVKPFYALRQVFFRHKVGRRALELGAKHISVYEIHPRCERDCGCDLVKHSVFQVKNLGSCREDLKSGQIYFNWYSKFSCWKFGFSWKLDLNQSFFGAIWKLIITRNANSKKLGSYMIPDFSCWDLGSLLLSGVQNLILEMTRHFHALMRSFLGYR